MEKKEAVSLREAFSHLSWQLLMVTENAAIAAARSAGKGDKHLADKAAVDAMRDTLDKMSGFSTNIKIGEGERDDAPMLFIGEQLGRGNIAIDIAGGPAGEHQCNRRPETGAVCVLVHLPGAGSYRPRIPTWISCASDARPRRWWISASRRREHPPHRGGFAPQGLRGIHRDHFGPPAERGADSAGSVHRRPVNLLLTAGT